MKEFLLGLFVTLLILSVYAYSGYSFEKMVVVHCTEKGQHRAMFSDKVIKCNVVEPIYLLKEG